MHKLIITVVSLFVLSGIGLALLPHSSPVRTLEKSHTAVKLIYPSR